MDAFIGSDSEDSDYTDHSKAAENLISSSADKVISTGISQLTAESWEVEGRDDDHECKIHVDGDYVFMAFGVLGRTSNLSPLSLFYPNFPVVFP